MKMTKVIPDTKNQKIIVTMHFEDCDEPQIMDFTLAEIRALISAVNKAESLIIHSQKVEVGSE